MQLVPSNWSSFSPEDRLELRNFVMGLIYERTRVLAPYNMTFLIALLARISKLGWLDECGLDSIVDDMTGFFQTSFAHCVVAMEVFQLLIQEVNQLWADHSPIQHRKYVTSFRDSALLQVFVSSFTLLRALVEGDYTDQDPGEQEKLAANALKVLIECLSFDFIGTLADDATSRNPTLQIPAEWAPHIEDSVNLNLLFTLYTAASSYSSRALEVLSLMVVIRKSLFSSESARNAFLNAHMDFAVRVLSDSIGLGDEQCYHHFCQYVSRFKANYHVVELTKLPSYETWLIALANFSVLSFESLGTSSGSIYYLLHFWNALCNSATHVATANTKLEHLVAELVRSFVTSRLASVEAVASGSIMEDPLGSQPLVHETLDAFPALGRFHYESSVRTILDAFGPLQEEYEGTVAQASQTGGAPEVLFQLEILENQLAWLVYLTAALIGGRTAVRKNAADDMLDGQLSVRVFSLLQASDTVLEQRGQEHANVHLERALIHFMTKFRKAHIGDQALSKSRAYEPLQQELDLPDSVSVLRVMIDKICVNLSAWSANEDLLNVTLALFMELAKAPFTSLPLLAKVPAVDYLLKEHGSGELEFLSNTDHSEPRKLFYRILGILIFQDANISKFDMFMACFGNALESIASVLESSDGEAAVSDPSFSSGLVGLFHDLTGVLISARKDSYYAVFFDWVYPTYIPVILELVAKFYDVPSVANAILRFWNEFVDAQSRRIKFPSHSANGILLFSATSKLLETYGSALLSSGFPHAAQELASHREESSGAGRNPKPSTPGSGGDGEHGIGDAQVEATFTGIELCIRILTNAFTGEYCCFGVFELYEDKSLVDAIDCVIHLILSIPFPLLTMYPSLNSAYYAFIETLARYHPGELLRQDSSVLSHILYSVRSGLQSFQRRVFTQSCCTLDYFMAFQFEILAREKHPNHSDLLQVHLDSEAMEVYSVLLETLMSIYLFDDNGKLPQWAVARPFLNFIVMYPDQYQTSRVNVISSQPPHRQEVVANAFELLLVDIDRDISTKNRDKFSQNLSAFRRALKQ